MPMLKALIVKNFEATNSKGLYEYGQFHVRIRRASFRFFATLIPPLFTHRIINFHGSVHVLFTTAHNSSTPL
jgi:hypothetical protein